MYNYDSRWHADAPKTRLQICGEDLVRNIDSFRQENADRPIIFIGHSLGGNVIMHVSATVCHAFSEPPRLLTYNHIEQALLYAESEEIGRAHV